MIAVFIRLYQKLVSPLLPANTCRFYPTCSSYAIEAIEEHGTTKGLIMAAWRLVRCHPLHPGGYDPVPRSTRYHNPGSGTSK